MDAGKFCTKCQVHKPFSEFTPIKRGKFGFDSRCRDCTRPLQREQRRRKSEERKAAKALLPKSEKVPLDPSIIKQRKERRRAAVKTEAAKQRRREYLARPDVRARMLELRNARYAAKEKTVAFKADSRLRVLIRRSASTGKNNRSWRDLVDFTIDEFQVHFEKQFTKGMSWDEFKAGNIEIDHIVPVASFNITSFDCPEFRACWSLGNLRPMWSAANNAKRAKRIFLL